MLQMATPAKPRINWPDLYLMAESESEAFADVRIVTARSEYDRQLAEHAMDAAFGAPFGAVGELTSDVCVRECVTVTDDGELSVVINASDVSDDAMWAALDMVADAMYQLNGESGTVYFGEPIKFTETNNPVVILR